MAAKTARFQVDSRLARLLSQEYPSTEKALKELVDNAWDADAENVHISLPAPMTDGPIVISDDGSGMTRQSLNRTTWQLRGTGATIAARGRLVSNGWSRGERASASLLA